MHPASVALLPYSSLPLDRRLLLSELSAPLFGALPLDETLAQVAALSVPRLADSCAVFVTEGEGFRPLARVSLAGGGGLGLLSGPLPPPLVAEFRARLETGRAQVVRDLGRWAHDQGLTPEPLPLGPVLFAPMLARARAVGVIALGWLEGGARGAGTEELALAEELARRCAVALDNARLHDELEAQKQALSRSEERYRSLVTATSQVVWTTSAGGETIEDSPSWRAFTGQTLEEMLRFGWLSAVHPVDRERLERKTREAREAARPYTLEFRVRRRDGGWAQVVDRGVPVFEPGGTVREWVGTLTDVTEARLAEERLQRESRINASLLKLGGTFSRELDPERLTQRITDEAALLLGAELGAFFKASDQGLVAVAVGGSLPKPNEATLAHIGEALEAMRFVGLASALSAKVRSAAGELLGVLYFGHREPDRFGEDQERLLDGLAVQAAIALENARLYRALTLSEEQARAAYRTAVIADRRKDEFLAMLGHELRNPLAPILTALQVMRLKEKGGKGDRERQIVERQVRHVVRLVDDLLDVARITRGKVELKRERVELGGIVARAIEIASPLFEERNHHLSVDLARELWVDADPARLAQVISNLLNNAAKYTEPGGQIEVGAVRDGERILLKVRDNGMGISVELMPRLFELFVQGERTLERAQGGLGIGLTVAKSLVHLHAGTIEAYSRGVGYGSEFRVRLPAAQAAAVQTITPAFPRKALERSRVLLVDDNRDAADVLAEALLGFGFEVRVAYDGPAALEVLERFTPDAALLDIGLPVMDGYELASRLRAKGPQGLHLVAITGYGQEADAERARSAGFDLHLVKPVDLEQVCEALSLAKAKR
jgi:PAS domain S-box-containing protein